MNRDEILTNAIAALNEHVEQLKYALHREDFSDEAWNDLHIAIHRIDEAEQHLCWARNPEGDDEE